MSAKERVQQATHRVMGPVNNYMSETKYAKYVVINGTSLARPVLGAAGMVEAWRGNWGHAEALFGIGYGTDIADGKGSRAWNATSGIGSKLDAAADFLIRLETLAAIFPKYE